MAYKSKNAHAGWGTISVYDLPNDNGAGGIIRRAAIASNQSSITLEFECEGHDGCTQCEYAYPLVIYGEGSHNVWVRLTARVYLNPSGSEKHVEFTGKAANNSSFSEPQWSSNPIKATWKYTVTVTKAEGGTINLYHCVATVTMDGTTSTVYNMTYDSNGMNYGSSGITNSIKNAIRSKVESILNGVLIDPLNGEWPQISTSQIDSYLSSIDSTFTSNYNDSQGSISIPHRSANTSTGRQIYKYGGGEVYQDRVTYVQVVKTVKGGTGDIFSLPAYNLTGTKFYIYTSATGGSPITDLYGNVAVMTVNSSTGGTSNIVTLNGALWANKTVYIEEVLPNGVVGYEKKDRIQVTLADYSKTRVVDIENIPHHDPVSINIRKVSDLNGGTFVEDVNLSGIEYTLSYYTSKSLGTATRTWKYKTNSNGSINFQYDTPVSGNRYTYNGEYVWPVGYYTLQETTNSETLKQKGLKLNPRTYYIEVSYDGVSENAISTVYTDSSFTTKAPNTYQNASYDARIFEFTTGTPNSFGIIEGELWETFSFVKKDNQLTSGRPQGDAFLAGAEFTLYSEKRDRFGSSGITIDGNTYSIRSSDGAVLVNGKPVIIVVDSNGIGKCPVILPKTNNSNSSRFYIVETKAPEGYELDTTKYYVDSSGEGTSDANNPSKKDLTSFTGVKVVQTYTIMIDSGTVKEAVYKLTSIEIQKYDDDTTDKMEQGDGSLQGIQFAIVNESTNRQQVYYNGRDIDYNAVVAIISTDAKGYATLSKLPYGTYGVYELSKDHGLSINSQYSKSAAVKSVYANASYTVMDNNKIGTAVLHPSDTTAAKLSYVVENEVVHAEIKVVKQDADITETQGDASLAGIRYAIVNRSNKYVRIDGYDYQVGEVIYIITTDETGVATLPKQYALPYGTYDIYELRLDSGVTEKCMYDDADKGTSIYANDAGYLYTSSVTVAKSPDNTYDVDKQTEKAYLHHNTYTHTFVNAIANGKLTVQKFDDDTINGVEQGDAYFSEDSATDNNHNIAFAIVNRSKHPVFYEGKKVDVGAVVSIHEVAIIDGVPGMTVFDNLPYGTYDVYELGRNYTIKAQDAYPTSSTDPSLGDAYYANDSYMLKNPGNPDRLIANVVIHPEDSDRVIVIDKDIANAVARGTITISKFDKESQSTKYNGAHQGDADFEGIRYAIVNRSDKFVRIHGVDYEPGEVVGIITTNAEGIGKFDEDGEYSIPYGTYDIYELRVDATIQPGDVYDGSSKLGTSIWANNHGYLYTENPINAETDNNNTFTIDSRNHKVRLDAHIYDTEFTNVPGKGTIVVQKNDGDLDGIGQNQGDASLAGIRYAVVNRSKKFIERNGEVFEPGEIIDIRATDANGYVTFDNDGEYTFPYGTYEIIELRLDSTLVKHDIYDGNPKIGTSPLANEYYVYTEDKNVAEVGANTNYTVDSRTHSFRDSKSTYEPTFNNYIIKGTIVITKEDKETTWAQGDEDFANIRYAIVNRSALPIERFGVMYNVGEVVAIIKTNHDGIARLDEEGKFTLPYGTYEIFELRLDATIEPGDDYDSSTKLGESIYANSTGFLYTEDVSITTVDSTTSDQFTVDSQDEAIRDLKGTYEHTFINAPAKGTLTLVKYDANMTDKPVTDDSNKEFKSGDANTVGIQYAVINVSTDPVTGEPRPVMYKGVIYNPNSIIDILTIRAEDNYEARLDKEGEFSLNYGTYWVYELRRDHSLSIGDEYPVDDPLDPRLGTSIYSNENGYMHNDKEELDRSALVTVTTDGEVDYGQYDVTLREPVIHRARTRFDYSFFNYPARGELLITKYDAETDMMKNQGSSHFTGIHYAIVNVSEYRVYYKDHIFEVGEIIDIVELEEDGSVHVTDVPYGTYNIYELRRDYTIEIGDEYPTSESHPNYEKLGKSIYANTWYLWCDEIYSKVLDRNTPDYTVEAQLGDEIRVAGETHTHKFSNVPIRSDFEHKKYDIDGNPMAFIPFSVSLLDDNGEILETHIIISDENGYLNTQTRPKNPATVNSLDQYYDPDTASYNGPLDAEAGMVNIWFGNIEDYIAEDIISSNRGSLIAGKYYVQELMCETNAGQDMLRHEFEAYEDRVVHSPRNVAIDLNIIMKSDAYDFGTHSKTLTISKNAKIRDTVDITHLKIYNEYKLETELMNVRKNGTIVSLGFAPPQIFVPEQYDETMTTYGTYQMIGTFDTTGAEPGSYVALVDRLYVKIDGAWSETPIRTHNEDLKDEKQMLHVPEISTHATNLETGTLIGSLDPDATKASDTIEYHYLGDMAFYNVEILVVNADGEIINDVFGNPCKQNFFLYTNDTSADAVNKVNNVFTSPTSGEIAMHEFGLEPFVVSDEYDTIGMVVTLYDAVTGEEVISHNADMDEADEIIRYIKLRTHAADYSGQFGVLTCSEEAELIDIIYYENLVKDAEVTIVGAVVDKETGDIITTATKKYTLTEGKGEIRLSFVFDSTSYGGKELVVFERAYFRYKDKDVLVSSHEDIEDTDQTVKVLDIHTTAVNPEDGTNILDGTKTEQTIIDKVEYHNLVVGQKYTLRGKLVVKPDDGSDDVEYVVDDNGDIIESSVTFIAEKSDGIIEVPFVINPSNYAGKKLVVFERLYFTKDIETDEDDDNNDDTDNDDKTDEDDTPDTEDTLIAVHEDVNDEDQTLNVTLLLHVSIAKADFDDVGYFLKGAEITIFNQDGTVATDIYGNKCIGITDENGSVDFVVLYSENNTYYAQETKAPEGYYLCEDKFEIHPTDDREALGTDLIKINILDEIIVIPPATGDPMTPIALSILGIGALGLGTLVAVKVTKSKKEKNNKENSD